MSIELSYADEQILANMLSIKKHCEHHELIFTMRYDGYVKQWRLTIVEPESGELRFRATDDNLAKGLIKLRTRIQ